MRWIFHPKYWILVGDYDWVVDEDFTLANITKFPPRNCTKYSFELYDRKYHIVDGSIIDNKNGRPSRDNIKEFMDTWGYIFK